MINLARMRLALLDVISNQQANQDAYQVFHAVANLLAPQQQHLMLQKRSTQEMTCLCEG